MTKSDYPSIQKIKEMLTGAEGKRLDKLRAAEAG